MNLDIFNSTIINIIHTSLWIIVRLNLEDLISNYQEEILLSMASSSFILDLAVLIRVYIKETNDSKLNHFSFEK